MEIHILKEKRKEIFEGCVCVSVSLTEFHSSLYSKCLQSPETILDVAITLEE